MSNFNAPTLAGDIINSNFNGLISNIYFIIEALLSYRWMTSINAQTPTPRLLKMFVWRRISCSWCWFNINQMCSIPSTIWRSWNIHWNGSIGSHANVHIAFLWVVHLYNRFVVSIHAERKHMPYSPPRSRYYFPLS